MAALEDLRDRLGEIHDLSRAASLLAWDERTMMPAAGAEARAETLGDAGARPSRDVLRGRDRAAVDQVRSGLAGEAAPGESVEADLVRVVARDWEKARRVPSELRAEMAHASSIAETAWVEAKHDPISRCSFPTCERTSS